MDTYIINAQEYYLANDVKVNYKPFYKGCQANVGKIINYHNLSDEYTYARYVNGSLVAGKNLSNNVDKLYLSEPWVDARLIELGLIENETGEDSDEPEVDNAPNILELKEHEKLTDNKGKIYEIEVRGERHPDKIYFKVKDISVLIESKHLCKNIIRQDRGYVIGEDYSKFYILGNNDPKDLGCDNNSNKPKLFFTYAGFLKCVFNTRNKNTSKFRKWATDVIFTAHLGTKPQKQDLAGKLIGVDKKTVREVFSKSVTSQPCIYLIYLGKAKDLADTFKIKDHKPNESIYKFGRSINLTKRMDQHHAKYSKLGCKVELVLFAYIDPIYNNDAENDIKEYFMDAGFKIDNKKYVELVKLDRQSLALTKSSYEKISIDNPVSPTNETPYPRIPRYVRYRDLLLVGLGKMLPPPFRESLHLELMTNVT